MDEQNQTNNISQRMNEITNNVQNILNKVNSQGNSSSTANTPGAQPDAQAATQNATPQENGPSSGEANTADSSSETANATETQRPIIYDGVSRAYADIDTGQFDTKAPRNVEKIKNSKSGSITPPKRERGGSKGKSGGDNIMEVFWNDYIMAFYLTAVDTVVDTTLDFAEWVLFEPFRAKQGTVNKETEKKAKNVYMIGDELYKERIEKFAKEKDKLIEINENLAKESQGIQPQWTLWGQVPPFYPKLKQIYAKAKENPQSPEAKFIEKYGFGVSADVIKGRFAKEETLFTLAVRLATIEEVTRPKQNGVSQAFSDTLKNLEDDLKNDKSGNVADIKNKISGRVAGLKNEMSEDEFAGISEKIGEMEALLQSNKNAKEIKKEALAITKEIQKQNIGLADNEDVIKGHILRNSKEKYRMMMENIDKIHEEYANDSEKTKETIKNYLTSINNVAKDVKKDTDKVVSPGMLGAKAYMKETKKSVENINKAINEFELNGQPIGSRDSAAQKDEFLLTEKQFSKAIRDYQLSR